jgi:LasA protease
VLPARIMRVHELPCVSDDRLGGRPVMIRLVTTILAGTVLLAGPCPSRFRQLACDDVCALTAAVADAFQPARGPAPIVEPKQWSADHNSVFGAAAVFPATGMMPMPVLFQARRTDRWWTVTLPAPGGFGAAPPPTAARTPAGDSAGGAVPVPVSPPRRGQGESAVTTGLALPWQVGTAWSHLGTHGDTLTATVFNAVDFYGGDGLVRASGPGRIYRLCTNARWPFVFVVHDNGWTTGYYHIRDITGRPDGSVVTTGEYLGHVGTELPCGGRARGDHVHWTLWQGSTPIAIDNKTVGGWTWHQGPVAYSGYAERAGISVPVQQCCALVNYG